MSTRLVREGDRLCLQGEVHFGNAEAVCAEGERLLREQPVAAIDLAGMGAASTLAVAVLVRWARANALAGRRTQLVNVPPKCEAIIRVSGLAPAFGLAEGAAHRLG